MKIKDYFIEWESSRVLTLILTIFVLSFLFFSWINVDVDTGEKVTGIVTSKGVNSATIYELPVPIINARLANGEEITMGIPRNRTVNIGDTIQLSTSEHLFSGGIKYSFIRVIKVAQRSN